MSSDGKYNTNDMDSDVIVHFPTVIAEVDAVGSGVRTLASAYQELRKVFSLCNDLSTISHNAIFKPRNFWTWRTLKIQETSYKALCWYTLQSALTEPSFIILFN